MKEKIKNTKGITLIALIITIIILLILAMVSIKLVLDGEIITHSKAAAEKYKEAQQNEIDQINNIFGNNENQNNVPDELQKYVLGDDLKGQNLENIYDSYNSTFLNLSNGEKVEHLITTGYCNTKENEEVDYGVIYIKYKNKAYRISIDVEKKGEWITKDVALMYEPKGREGQKIEYSYDGTEANKKEWIIIYDNGNNLEIVSPNTMGELGLGYDDTEVEGKDEFEKAINSYNNAIETINNYTNSLVTNSNKISVRSAGSNPNNPNSRNTSKYTSEKVEAWSGTYYGWGKVYDSNRKIDVNINGVAERSDNNYEHDVIRMSFYGIIDAEENYWLASRTAINNDSDISFNIRNTYDNGNILGTSLWHINKSENRCTASYIKRGVRPIVKIKY